MREEQRKVAESTQGLAELGCAGQGVNLTIEDFHKKSERESQEANVVRDLVGNVLRRFYGRFVRPKWNHGGIGDVFKRLPRFYSKIVALLKSPSDGGTFLLRFTAGEKSSWVVQQKARAPTARRGMASGGRQPIFLGCPWRSQVTTQTSGTSSSRQ